ncbi:MAG: hypothetical protein D9V44_07185 [Actinobacteria bacterium]|nr:MAG: hypothetical protein D9V44_07185 [Actinomycetota bacterium]
MGLAVATFIIVFEIVAVVAFLVGVPLAFGVMAYDIMQSRKNAVPKAAERAVVKDNIMRITVERGVARAFVLLGGIFWSIATFAGMYSFGTSGTGEAVMGAVVPLAAVLVTLVLGWYYERFTAALLLLASLAVVAWGIIYQFEAGVWGIMTFALIGPMLTASALFWLARREQEAYERAYSIKPELAFAFAARSSLG